MPHAPHPIRDGVIAVSLGAVLALLLIVGVHALQSPNGLRERVEPELPMNTPGLGSDACRSGGGGGGGAPEPHPTPGSEFPRQEFSLDTGRPVEVQSSGNAEIAYQRLSEFATVVSFDCENCAGDLTVFNAGAGVPILSGRTAGEPVHIEWLIDTVHEEADDPRNSLLVRATGDWTLALRSWFDLPVRSGTISGTGSAVVRLDAAQVRLTFAPLNSRDALNAYAYRQADGEFRANTCLGRRESRVLDLNGGQVLLLWARGDWILDTG